MRGLKPIFVRQDISKGLSHLLQMRGLKLTVVYLFFVMRKSHLLQMRGLKHTKDVDSQTPYLVASFTDAWIETRIAYREIICNTVASFTDAWIETRTRRANSSHSRVASFTDAWIETDSLARKVLEIESHLLQMRGLKLGEHPNQNQCYSRIFYRCVD